MATAVLRVGDRFPPGSEVSAYPMSNWAAFLLPPAGAAVGASTETQTVATDGTLTFSALDEVAYVAYAEVAGQHRYVSFSAVRSTQDVRSADVAGIVVLTQAAYDALGTPDDATLYVVVG